MTQASLKLKRQPPASLFALGHGHLPAKVESRGRIYRFSKLYKHDFFAATGLYERVDEATESGQPGHWAVLKVQRTYPYFGWPMKWLGKRVARHEIRIYETLQGVPGIPIFLGQIGPTGFLHEFVPGEELHAKLPLTPQFFVELQAIFEAVHERNVAYVDSNKRENILLGEDGKPWLIDFQISFGCDKGIAACFASRWMFRRLVRADWYHFYKHKTRLLPSACAPEDFERARDRGFLHRLHRCLARPMIYVRRRILSRYDLVKTR